MKEEAIQAIVDRVIKFKLTTLLQTYLCFHAIKDNNFDSPIEALAKNDVEVYPDENADSNADSHRDCARFSETEFEIVTEIGMEEEDCIRILFEVLREESTLDTFVYKDETYYYNVEDDRIRRLQDLCWFCFHYTKGGEFVVIERLNNNIAADKPCLNIYGYGTRQCTRRTRRRTADTLKTMGFAICTEPEKNLSITASQPKPSSTRA